MNTHIAIVDKNKCNPNRCNQECIKYDPVNRSGGEGFHIGEDGKATISEEKTLEAHSICANKCPFSAIKIVKLPQQLDSDPIHQYGQNGFRVFNVPTPIAGKVVGIAGRNGIGKSTVFNILSGQIKPNLGTDQPVDIQEIISYFKGSETQRYFEQMRDGKLSYGLKPQAINGIPQHFDGTVSELLSKVTDDKVKLQDYASRLELDPVLDRSVKNISGGELQRVAICATALKDVQVYFFDEPTSFLDVYQRLEVAKFIRNLADEGKSVLVIEHDLIILDAIADTIHIAFGDEGAYGVISGPKSTKAGLNMYLSGMLPQENIRFRSNAISFKKGQDKGQAITEPITQWKASTTKLGSFTLDTNDGVLHKHEVVGVLGQNGTGKTTFVKSLVENHDEEINVGYKPQYIDTENDDLVMIYLQDAIKKFDKQLISPLNIKPLFEKQLNELSGGQLQRVAIAKALSAEAELFLLDEPSAYLDAEQRLQVSKVIKDFMLETGKTALVVDHDLLFIDYISDRLLVFGGQPGVHGTVSGPFSMQEGMNNFLKLVNITFRRDEESERPRVNKPGSQIDQNKSRTIFGITYNRRSSEPTSFLISITYYLYERVQHNCRSEF